MQLVFQDCAPSSDRPDLPATPATSLTLEGTSSQTNIVNFNVSRSVILTYRARASHPGPVSIPAFTVDTNKGPLRVPAFTGGAGTRSAAQIDVKSIIEPGSTTVWAGEIFPLTYTLDVGRRTLNQVSPTIDWNSAPLVTEEWSKLEQRDAFVNGEPRINIIARTRGYAKSPGPVTLNAATQIISVQSGSVGFGLFQMPRVEQLTVTSNTPDLVVRPLPAAPDGFHGAVGQFKLTSKVVPTTAGIGEPVTWTLELTGTGNWPDIAGLPQREVSKDFNVVQPKAKRTPVDGKLFDQTLTEDVVLVPTQAGSYPLEPVSFVYFDPQSGTYKTITTPATTITITPPAAAPTTAAPQSQTPAAAPAENGGATPSSRNAPSAPDLSHLKTKVPTFPSGLPRDPLSGSAPAMVPLRLRTLVLLLLSPFALLLALWVTLAIRRARQTDPLRPQREARARLAHLLAQLRSAQTGSSSQLSAPSSQSSSNSQLAPTSRPSPLAPRLLSWQHDTAVLFQIPHAAPPAIALSQFHGDGVPSARTESDTKTWIQLWLEADRAIYGPSRDLPSDWTARAEAALATKKLPGFSPLRLFLPQNLLPFVALLALLLVPLSVLHADETQNPEPKNQNPDGSAASAGAAYHSGDFPAAEKAWTAAVAAHPTDAVARYDLSLALAQQDRWPEAAAQAAAAFVQKPSLAPVAWQLAIACENGNYVPAPLSGFLPPGPAESLARFLAPASWQVALILATVIAALGLALLLLDAYGRRSRLRRIAAFVVVALGILLAASAAVSLHAYGDTADSRAVIAWRAGVLRSIPTEADTTQKTTPLAPGTVALGEKTLLGWIRLRFPNGQTGWVRQEEVIALWR
ncbi:MAG TPA: BatD family protein [Opitutus sp.]|nr:BatD family protein [Opitutus sp.]